MKIAAALVSVLILVLGRMVIASGPPFMPHGYFVRDILSLLMTVSIAMRSPRSGSFPCRRPVSMTELDALNACLIALGAQYPGIEQIRGRFGRFVRVVARDYRLV